MKLNKELLSSICICFIIIMSRAWRVWVTRHQKRSLKLRSLMTGGNEATDFIWLVDMFDHAVLFFLNQNLQENDDSRIRWIKLYLRAWRPCRILRGAQGSHVISVLEMIRNYTVTMNWLFLTGWLYIPCSVLVNGRPNFGSKHRLSTF